ALRPDGLDIKSGSWELVCFGELFLAVFEDEDNGENDDNIKS
ncbi:20739_t:CDS:2, partial [Racocetra persica]